MDGKGSGAHIDNKVALNLGAYELAITSSILSFFNSSVTFCGGGGDGMRISIGI